VQLIAETPNSWLLGDRLYNAMMLPELPRTIQGSKTTERILMLTLCGLSPERELVT
jgi:hypothetical protein